MRTSFSRGICSSSLKNGAHVMSNFAKPALQKVHSSNCQNMSCANESQDRILGTFPIHFTSNQRQSLVSSADHDNIDVQFDKFGIPVSNYPRSYETIPVPLHNGRQLSTSLDKEGMLLSNHKYSHIDYYNFEDVVSSYYPELERHIKKTIPYAQRVIAFHHQVRSWRKNVVMGRIEGQQQKPKAPVCFAHSDYSLRGGIARLQTLGQPPLPRDCWGHIHRCKGERPLLTADEVTHFCAEGDFMIIHAWRNISRRKLQLHPLALCCADTVRESELLSYDLCYSDHTEGVMAVRYHDSQKWLYFKDMDRDELLLFKQYDTRGTFSRAHTDITGHFSRHNGSQYQKSPTDAPFISCHSPHSSFQDSDTCAGTEGDGEKKGMCYPGRESIEAAILVLLN